MSENLLRQKYDFRRTKRSDMQKALCSAFSKPYPKTEAGLVVNETLFFDACSDRPLIHAAECKDIRIIFATQTDMRHVDACFRGPRPSFEEDMMRETPAASE